MYIKLNFFYDSIPAAIFQDSNRYMTFTINTYAFDYVRHRFFTPTCLGIEFEFNNPLKKLIKTDMKICL